MPQFFLTTFVKFTWDDGIKHWSQCPAYSENSISAADEEGLRGLPKTPQQVP